MRKIMAIVEFESSIEVEQPAVVEPIVVLELPKIISLGLETGVWGIDNTVWVARNEVGEAL